MSSTYLTSARRRSTIVAPAIPPAHPAVTGRPIETLWDAVTAVTAKARGIQWQDERVALERQAGQLLRLAA